ncbi:nitroreductase [Methanocella sp. CWC-04]|uniref:Nitroreductase n=2 Tax=Methanooceanicella nereidis TaxID=2052831 RepID=A0AAP2W6I1_9EURY|nr:nitroreductase [Methanocella sp. CWC-04]
MLLAGCIHPQEDITAVTLSPLSGSIKLPEPSHDSDTSVEEALSSRRSVREFKDASLTLTEISQLLWAAQGITDPRGFRTAPSAGALYPLEVYVVAGNVEGLAPGVYKYRPAGHDLIPVKEGDARDGLCKAALGQPCVKGGAVDIVISGVYEMTTGKYSTPEQDYRTGASYPRGVKYVHMEAGHSAQNVCLQAESLGLGTVTIGAFSDSEVKRIIGMPEEERPLYIMPVGRV